MQTKYGKTRVKITDTKNKYETYIIVNVISDVTVPQLKVEDDFTLALKANGTVWAFGNGENGKLGNGNEENSNEPVQVIKEDKTELKNILDIGIGKNSGIAVNSNGEVYTFGKTISSSVDGEDTETVSNKAKKVDGLSNICKVEAKDENYYAVDDLRKVIYMGQRI